MKTSVVVEPVRTTVEVQTTKQVLEVLVPSVSVVAVGVQGPPGPTATGDVVTHTIFTADTKILASVDVEKFHKGFELTTKVSTRIRQQHISTKIRNSTGHWSASDVSGDYIDFGLNVTVVGLKAQISLTNNEAEPLTVILRTVV